MLLSNNTKNGNYCWRYLGRTELALTITVVSGLDLLGQERAHPRNYRQDRCTSTLQVSNQLSCQRSSDDAILGDVGASE